MILKKYLIDLFDLLVKDSLIDPFDVFVSSLLGGHCRMWVRLLWSCLFVLDDIPSSYWLTGASVWLSPWDTQVS